MLNSRAPACLTPVDHSCLRVSGGLTVREGAEKSGAMTPRDTNGRPNALLGTNAKGPPTAGPGTKLGSSPRDKLARSARPALMTVRFPLLCHTAPSST